VKIAVIGAGAVGGYFGGRLAANGNDVVFLVRGKTFEALRAKPLRVESINGDFEARVRTTDDPAHAGEIDAVLVAVKAWQVPEAAAAIARMPLRDALVVPLQNGMEAPEQLAAVLGWERVAGGLCRIVSETVSPGHIRHYSAEPSIAMGELWPVRHANGLEELCEAFRAAAVRCDIATDIKAAMWEKFLFIAPWGSLAAVTRLPIGAIRRAPELRDRLLAALEELAAVARAEGISLETARTLGMLDRLPEDTTSSMQRDIMAGRPSELEAQTGAVVRLGRKAGLPTPVHEAIYAELLPLEQRARGTA
jgi:2-dehydropantoate 2-reductase